MNATIAPQWEGGMGLYFHADSWFIRLTLASVTTGTASTYDEVIMRPYLGIESSMLSKATAKTLNISKFSGIFIHTVQPNSPAATADSSFWWYYHWNQQSMSTRRYANSPLYSLYIKLMR